MNLVVRFALAFLGISIVSAVLSQQYDVPFGDTNYWDVRGVFFLIFIAIFPRLTLLFSSVVTGGLLWWVGWLFVPRVLVAILATFAYWNTNKVLVTIAWVFAIGGESTEKVAMTRVAKVRVLRRTPETGQGREQVIDV